MSNPLFLRPGSRSPWPVLRPVGDRTHGQSISINRQICVIGARSRVHLPLESTMISRTHAIVINDREETYVRDLASTNRIYLNGCAVREARLNKADLLRIGPFTFFCHTGFPAPADLLEADAGGPSERATVVVEGSNQRVPIHGRTLLIGQREGCDVRLDKPLVSRTHAIIYSRDGKRFLRDLNSSSGTFLNDRKVREAELRNGDAIRIGVALLKYESEHVEPRPEQLRLKDSDDDGSMMATEASLSRIFSTSASFGGATVDGASVGCLTLPGGFDIPQRGEVAEQCPVKEFGFSSGVLPPARKPAEGGAAVNNSRPSANRPPHRHPRPALAGSALKGLMDKFAPALAAAQVEQMPSPHTADVPPGDSNGQIILPSFDSSSGLGSKAIPIPARPTSPAELRAIEMATAEDLFAPAGKSAGAPSAAGAPPPSGDLLEDAFLREVGLGDRK